VVALAAVAMGARFFWVIHKNAVNVFFMDQWDNLSPFFTGQPNFTRLFFWQPGIQRIGIGLFADKFLYPPMHWNARIDPFFIGACIFAAMLLALLLKRKLFGPLSYSDIAIPLIFLTLAQWEVLFNAPDPSYSGLPLLLMMLYCLALLQQNRLRRYAFVLALNFILIYTGYGLFMGPITLGVFLTECYWSWHRLTATPFVYASAGLLIAAASLASFFIHYEFRPGVSCFELSYRNLLLYPHFMALMFSAFLVPRPFLLSSGVAVLGVATLVVLIAVFCSNVLHSLRSPCPASYLTGAVLATFGLLYTISTSVGRVCLGLNFAFSSRYSSLLIPPFLGIYFYLLSRSWHGKRALMLIFWILLLLPAALFEPSDDIRWFAEGSATGPSVTCGVAVFTPVTRAQTLY